MSYSGLGAPGDTKPVSVLTLQKLLLNKGVSVGSSGADGVWGSRTAKGLKSACRRSKAPNRLCGIAKPSASKRSVSIPADVFAAIMDMPAKPKTDPAEVRQITKRPFNVEYRADRKQMFKTLSGSAEETAMSYRGLGTGFDISHAGAPYQGMLGLGAEGVPMDTVKVRSLQKLLLKKGFSVGSTGVDGIWGPNTKSGFNEACASDELLADPSFCKNLEVAPGKRYVKIPSVLHKAIIDMPDDPIPDPAAGRGRTPRATTSMMPDLFDTGAEGNGKVWPWVVGIGSSVLLLGGLWYWYQQEQQGRRPVTPNRRRRRRR